MGEAGEGLGPAAWGGTFLYFKVIKVGEHEGRRLPGGFSFLVSELRLTNELDFNMNKR